MSGSNNFYTNVDTRGSKVYLRYIEDGEQKSEIIEFSPELYIKTNDAAAADALSMHDEPLERVIFSDSREMHKFVESYKDVDGFSVFGSESIMNQFVSSCYPGIIKYDHKSIKGGILDIETFSGDIKLDDDGKIVITDGPFPNPETADYPISMLTLYCTDDDTYYVWALEEFNGIYIGTYLHNKDHKRIGDKKVKYFGFKQESTMLTNFCEFWKIKDFNYWTGWYIAGFDNPYMTNRIENLCGVSIKNKLSPWGQVLKRTNKNDWGGENTVFEYLGCQMLDYKEVFEKHGYMNPDNTKLNTVAEMILGEGKIDYADEGNLNTLYIRNFQKAVEYNIVDVDLIVQMERKKKFLELTFILAYLTKSNYSDTLGTVRPWSALAYSMLYDKGQRPRIKSAYQGDVQFGGGFVREIKGGRYRWVVSIDLNSLYPHLIQQYNLGAETIVEPEDLPDEVKAINNFTLDDLVNKRVDLSVLKKYNICMTANRAFFKRGKKSIFNEKTRDIYDTRKAVKKEMLKLEQILVDTKAKLESSNSHKDVEDTIAELEGKISSLNVHQNSLKIL